MTSTLLPQAKAAFA